MNDPDVPRSGHEIPIPEINPPLGLTPRWVVEEHRLEEILDAIHRYRNASYPIPLPWYEELRDLLDRHVARQHQLDEGRRMLPPRVKPVQGTSYGI